MSYMSLLCYRILSKKLLSKSIFMDGNGIPACNRLLQCYCHDHFACFAHTRVLRSQVCKAS